MAGLSAYSSAYHLRPRVQIRQAAIFRLRAISIWRAIVMDRMRIETRIPLAMAPANQCALVVRAGGSFAVKGSISDGFKSSAGTSAAYTVINITNGTLFKNDADMYADL